jgi:DNA repair exonuclease SbcCD ATPase subunit
MSDLSQRLRDPLVMIILVIAIAGWLAFFAMWINAANQAGQLQQTVASLTSERDDVAQRLTAHETAQGELATLQEQIAQAQQDLAANSASLETVRNDLGARQKDLDTVTADLEARRTETTELQQQADAANQLTAELTEQQQNLQGQIDAANQQLTDIGARLEAARQQEAAATASAAQLTNEAATTTSSLADLQTQLQTAREQLTSAQTQLADLAGQSETAGTDLQALQQQLADLQTRRDQLTAEVQGYQTQRDELQPQVEQLAQTVTQRGEELKQIESRIATAVASADVAAAAGRYTVSGEGEARGLTLTLDPAGKFTLVDRTNRSVNGDYTLTDNQLMLTNVQGALGNAQFPMTCPVAANDNGFTIGDGPGCVLSGLAFDRSP